MKFKHIVAAGALLASSTAMASDLTGNVGAVSTYMFRGIDQTGGAAIQGGADYTFDMGLYTGLWISNSTVGGGNESDAYVGYGVKLGGFGLDVGAIYYGYSEDTETAFNRDYAEVFVGGSFGPVALKVFYAPEYGGDIDLVTGNGDKDSLLYITASAALPLSDTLSLTPQIGFSSGDGAKDAFGDEYADYSLTVTKTLKDDVSVTLAVVSTDRDLAVDQKDNPKFVIGFKKNFDI